MVRTFFAVVLGIVAGMGAIALMHAASGLVWPVPAGLDYNDPVQMRAYIAAMPMAPKTAVVGSWLTGAFIGGLVTVLVARHKTMLALVPGLVIAAATIANAMMLPHPMWMPATGVLLAVPMAWLGGALGVRLVRAKPSDGGAWKGGMR